MYYIGFDPGKDGAAAWINPENGHADTMPFSETGYTALCYQMKGKAKAVLERAGARPGQGVTSMFSFGENYGFIRGLLEANGIPYEIVHPQKWKKHFSVTSDKNTSVKVAKRLFPDVDLRKNYRCRKDHDGSAEALLLAEYARRHVK